MSALRKNKWFVISLIIVIILTVIVIRFPNYYSEKVKCESREEGITAPGEHFEWKYEHNKCVRYGGFGTMSFYESLIKNYK